MAHAYILYDFVLMVAKFVKIAIDFGKVHILVKVVFQIFHSSSLARRICQTGLYKLSDHQHEIVQDISVRHTAKLFGGNIGVLFYDVTTLYFEADYEDELRKTGFSKEGRHSNPQIILGLLVSLGGYPLAYCIHEGNKYEGHTMLPTINEFVSKYGLFGMMIRSRMNGRIISTGFIPLSIDR